MQPAPPKVPPVAADMETVCTQGNSTTKTSSKFFRDEMSRTRIETGDMASISDPVKGQNFVLNMPQKIAMPAQPKPPLPGMPAMPGMPGKPNVALPQVSPPQMQETKDLGQKMIDGIKVHGKQYSMPAKPAVPAMPGMPPKPGMPSPPAMPGAPAIPSAPPPPGMPQPPTAEVWSSHDLKLPIQSSVTNPATGTNCVTQMKNVKSGVKLPESMFQVPPGFKVATPKPPALAGPKLP